MCGICGFIEPGGFNDQEAESQLRAMATRLSHRGPDSDGYWLDGVTGVGFGHRRLSVLDLSNAGHQPMTSRSGRYVLIFNGEIYNHEALRRELDLGDWNGRSDTETLLALIDDAGIAQSLQRSDGMFALAVWDRQLQRITLARDRMGEKPLYYGWQRGVLLFGSELKAFSPHRAFEARVDHRALAGYLQGGYVKGVESIFHGVRKLPPGCTWSWQVSDGVGTLAEPIPYWSLEAAIEEGKANPFIGSAIEAVDELERLLVRAVSAQMIADVPIGAFLSGGVDSSTVVAIMQSIAEQPIKTFTIGTTDQALDESQSAAAIADHLGTDHTSLTVTAEDALSIATRLGEIYDEPFGDSSAVPTYLVAGLASQEVTVALSGDGGDELFAGYQRYADTIRAWKLVGRVPRVLRKTSRAALDIVPWELLENRLGRARASSPAKALLERLRSTRASLSAESVDEFYRSRISNLPDPCAYMKRGDAPYEAWADSQPTDRSEITERMMAYDMRTYLPDDILVKVDRAASAHSLETRIPLLSRAIIEFNWRLDPQLRVSEGTTKWILRQVLYRHVPRQLVDRPKRGFAVPVADWLRGPLREWAEDLLSTQSLDSHSPFNSTPIRRLWAKHLQGEDWQYVIWPILTYLQWARSNRISV